jgi:thioredoxin 1
MLSHARRRNGGTMNRRNFAALLLAAIAAPLAAGHARAMQFMEYRADSFVKLLATGNPLVVHVHADWCTVCRAQMPVMDRVLAGPAYKNVHAVRVNFDHEKRFLADYKVVRQSTIIVFRGGKEIARLTYDADPQRIEQTLARAIS